MTPRQAETSLARFVLAMLLLYVSLKIWFSVSYGLSNLFYLVDHGFGGAHYHPGGLQCF